MFWVFLALVLIGAGVFFPKKLSIGNAFIEGFARSGIRFLLLFLALLSVLSTSYVFVSSDEIGQLSRIYWAKPLPSGHIIALKGEKGPQAEILGPGFNYRFMLNVLYRVEKKMVTKVEAGHYGKLVALDGEPLRPGQTFADSIGSLNQMLDAEYFLTHKGQRGPQIVVLTPSSYRINTYLWQVVTDDKYTDVEKGFGVVVKSNAWSSVDFGNLSVPKPKDCRPTKVTDLSGGKLAVPLVPVGCIGIWDQPLLNGRYYINEDVYQVTKMDTRVQAWLFKGGFKKRQIALEVDQQGKIKQTETSTDELVLPEYADKAVFLKVEGWDIPQELRVLVQIPPENTPIVVASVGDEKEVEHRIIVPIVRAIVRDVTGGGFMKFTDVNEKGELVETVRQPRVLDLLVNRPALEARILEVMRPEGEKAGVEIKEIRFGDPAVPPELLVARLRQQLAGQLKASYEQEKLAQDARIATENAKNNADKQGDLVTSQIGLQRAELDKKAAELGGQGQKLQLEAIAEGQKAQAAVLGQNKVVELRKYEFFVGKAFDLFEKNPNLLVEMLKNASKLVPNTNIVVSGKNGIDLSGPAAILGSFLKGPDATNQSTPPTAGSDKE